MNIDFSLVLAILVFVTGIIWSVDHFFFARKRQQQTEDAKDPLVVEYAKFLFPVVAIVFVLRGFIAEPFRIPSGSMLPTLEVGDFILVNKFSYGLRVPVLNYKLIEIDDPKRGDVVVFRYPEDPSIDYIKRVIGLPGDKIAYYNKTLYVNGDPQTQVPKGSYEVQHYGRFARLQENLNNIEHDILINQYIATADATYEVPAGHYFVMGDNRDNSRDSRYWGFVPNKNLVGRAFLVWMNWGRGNGLSWERIGTVIK